MNNLDIHQYESLPDTNRVGEVIGDMAEPVVDTMATTFFQQSPVSSLVQHAIVPVQTDWIAYLLLALLAGLAIIFFLTPEKLNNIASQALIRNQLRTSDKSNPGSGAVIQMYLFANYLATMSLFIFFMLLHFYFSDDIPEEYLFTLILITAFVFTLYFYRLGMIRLFGVLFRTGSPAYLQQKLYASTDFIIGIILIPVLLLTIYMENDILFFAGIFIVFITHVFRWFQTFFLGKSIVGVSVIHLIMYLCTLEIAPLLVVIKLIQTF